MRVFVPREGEDGTFVTHDAALYQRLPSGAIRRIGVVTTRDGAFVGIGHVKVKGKAARRAEKLARRRQREVQA